MPKSLRPKARLLKTLGDELISSEVVALIELVKNSYDADANRVSINFIQNESGEKSIFFIDDGIGMTSSIIENKLMIIATDNKKKGDRKTKKRRRYLGEKGIGRFAVARLSNELQLITKTKDMSSEVHAEFDWTQYEDPDLYLDQIQNKLEEKQTDEVNASLIKYAMIEAGSHPVQGTLLKMNGLKHSWEDRDFKDLRRGLSRLISPHKENSDFSIMLNAPEEFQSYSGEISSVDIVKYPHYTVEGHVDCRGKFDYLITDKSTGKDSIHSGFFYPTEIGGEWNLIEYDEPFDEEYLADESNNCRVIDSGPVTFELRFWDRDNLDNIAQKVGYGIRSIRQELDAVAGINIYRDGFRVLPYGEPNNDWLRLDIRRVQKPSLRISNNQIIGYITIDADNNPNLKDQSNREGLDNNVAYRDLEMIMLKIISSFEAFRKTSKKKTNTGSGEKPGEQAGLFEPISFEDIKSSISNNSDPKKTIGLIADVEKKVEARVERFKDVISQYHALATLGGIVDKVLHDGRQPLATIRTEAGLSKEIIEDVLRMVSDESKADVEEVRDGLVKIDKQASVINDVFRRVEPFGGRKKGRPKKLYMEDIIKDVFSNYHQELKSAGIQFSISNTETLVSVDYSEMAEVFTNLLTNSIYWLQAVPKESRYVTVEVSRTGGGGVEILFSDTGPGIRKDIKDRIFEPYVSGRESGNGLGLNLIGEIVKDYYGGTFELLDSDSGAEFRVLLTKRI